MHFSVKSLSAYHIKHHNKIGIPETDTRKTSPVVNADYGNPFLKSADVGMANLFLENVVLSHKIFKIEENSPKACIYNMMGKFCPEKVFWEQPDNSVTGPNIELTIANKLARSGIL